MHMADALISTAVGGTMIAASAGVAANSISRVKKTMDDSRIPLMGVMGAFVFAAQMVNFSIPGTGSSGHLAGALLLAVILGPHAGFLTMASVLIVQALFFADGGLLALGCNILNLGFYTCFIAYPFIYRPLAGKRSSFGQILPASLIASAAGLQLGAFSVVMQTLLSGKTELPFAKFLLLMQPIHLAIAVVEGIVTAAVIAAVQKARPEILQAGEKEKHPVRLRMRKTVIAIAIVSVIIAGFVSWFASSDPDGLEWSIFKTTGQEELAADDAVHSAAGGIQEKTSILPDYSIGGQEDNIPEDISTSVAGIAGIVIMMVFLWFTGTMMIRIRKKKEISKAG